MALPAVPPFPLTMAVVLPLGRTMMMADSLRRNETAGLNLRLLRICLIIVRGNHTAVRVAQFQHRVDQDIGNSKMRQGLAKRTHDYLGPAIAGDIRRSSHSD